jgi:plastocyanin
VITIKDFQYELPDSVAPGATVTVINEDAAPHTVTAENDGGFDAIAAGGETVTFTAPEEPGEYPIICTYHPQMSATLVVQ